MQHNTAIYLVRYSAHARAQRTHAAKACVAVLFV